MANFSELASHLFSSQQNFLEIPISTTFCRQKRRSSAAMIIGNRYEVVEKIHKGSWATIYKVKDVRDEKFYVLKLFSKLSSHEFYSRFSPEELTRLTGIKHHNLVRTYDFGFFGKSIYSISAYYDLPSLEKFLFAKIEDIYTIIKGLCLGLEALHKENILHQNLRLENILYDPKTLEVKILECNFVDNERSKQEIIVDYLPYLAPEVYEGGQAVVPSDLYSLGIVLYYITCGRFPFSIHQIQNLQNHENYYPTPPSKINPQVPAALDTLILRLLSRFPQERFQNTNQILQYLNSYSGKKKIILTQADKSVPLAFGKTTIHRKLLEQLLANLRTVHQQKNGKILHIIGDSGVGKSSLLKQFRYSIFSDSFAIFSYKCSQDNIDPLFTIAKETMSKESLDKVTKEFSQISEKYRKFLIHSEKEALAIPDTEEKVQMDTEFIKKTIFAAAEEKTLVIIIENADYLHEKTTKALDIISKSINSHPVFIVITGEKHDAFDSVVYKNKKFIPNLNRAETKNFILSVTKGLHIHENIINLVVEKSTGNPKFIKKILLQLYKDNLLGKEKIPANYRLPLAINSNIKQTILESLRHLPDYPLIKKLAFFLLPISSQSMQKILEISQKKSCFLLSELINAHIIHHEQEVYKFNSAQIKQSLQQELTLPEKKSLIKCAFSHYQDQPIADLATAEGLLDYALIIKDFEKIRKYNLLCAKLHLQNFQHQEAYNHYFQVGKLHALGYLPAKFRSQDLQELTLNSKLHTLKSLQLLSQFPEKENEKLRAILLQDARKTDLAEKLFDQLQLGTSKIDDIIRMRKIRNKLILHKLDQAEILLENYTPKSQKDEVYKIIMQAELLLKQKKPAAAALMLKEFIKSNEFEKISDEYILAKLYHVLGNSLHIRRNLEEGEKFYLKAQNILKKNNFLVGLCSNYNDLGGLYLTGGDIGKALKYLRKAQKISQNYPSGKLRVAYTYGKAYLKLGKFKKAIEYFEIAKKVCHETENQKRFKMCQMHISSCLMKYKGYGDFYRYVLDFRPEIFDWEVESFDPLVRTFFVYLIATEQSNELEQKLEQNSHLYFKSEDHYEHYYSLLGSIAYHKQKYDLAIKHFEHAINLVKTTHNYALAILLYKLCKVYTAKKAFENAKVVCGQLSDLCEKYKFGYWQSHANLEKLKIELFSGKIGYRRAFEKAKKALNFCKEKNYFVQILDYYGIIIQILDFYKLSGKAESYFTLYKDKIDEICQGLPQDVEKRVKKRYHYNNKDFSKLLKFKLPAQKQIKIADEQKNFLKILEIRDIERIKFFIWQMVNKFFAPSGFLVLVDGQEFCNQNIPPEQVKIYQENFYLQKTSNFGKNSLAAPLQIDRVDRGLIVLVNDSEIPYKIKEKNLFHKLLPYLSYVIFQIVNVDKIQTQKKLLQKMMNLNILDCIDTKQIMANVLTFLIEITDAKRGFWIEKDYLNSASGANLWRIGIDNQGSYILAQNFVSNYLIDSFEKQKNFFKISSSLVSDKSFVQTLQRFSIKDFEIMLFPIILDNKIDSFLYLDTFDDNKKPAKMLINKEFMHSFTDYIDKMLQTFKLNQKLKVQLEKQQKVIQTKSAAIKIIDENFLQPIKDIKKELQDSPAEIDKAVCELSFLEHSIASAFFFNNPNSLKYSSPLSYSLRDLSQEVLDNYQLLTKKLKIKFSVEFDKLKVNKKTFLLVLDNIILNALQNAQTYLEIGSRMSKFDNERVDNQDSLVIFVRNDGQIPDKEELRNSLQNPFSQDSRQSVRKIWASG